MYPTSFPFAFNAASGFHPIFPNIVLELFNAYKAGDHTTCINTNPHFESGFVGSVYFGFAFILLFQNLLSNDFPLNL